MAQSSSFIVVNIGLELLRVLFESFFSPFAMMANGGFQK
jgi:hypothetical protein